MAFFDTFLKHVGQNYWHPFIKYFLQPPFSVIIPDQFEEHILSFRISPDSQFGPIIFYRVQVKGLGWSLEKLHFLLSDTFLFILMFVLDRCPDERSNQDPL